MKQIADIEGEIVSQEEIIWEKFGNIRFEGDHVSLLHNS
jgi:hypothetical protein